MTTATLFPSMYTGHKLPYHPTQRDRERREREIKMETYWKTVGLIVWWGTDIAWTTQERVSFIFANWILNLHEPTFTPFMFGACLNYFEFRPTKCIRAITSKRKKQPTILKMNLVFFCSAFNFLCYQMWPGRN